MSEVTLPNKDVDELGLIIQSKFTAEQIRHGYGIDPTDTMEVGLQALLWGDINPDGTIN